MENPASRNANQGLSVAVKKDWKKPVLDILELENAQLGTAGTHDNVHTYHRSGH